MTTRLPARRASLAAPAVVGFHDSLVGHAGRWTNASQAAPIIWSASTVSSIPGTCPICATKPLPIQPAPLAPTRIGVPAAASLPQLVVDHGLS